MEDVVFNPGNLRVVQEDPKKDKGKKAVHSLRGEGVVEKTYAINGSNGYLAMSEKVGALVGPAIEPLLAVTKGNLEGKGPLNGSYRTVVRLDRNGNPTSARIVQAGKKDREVKTITPEMEQAVKTVQAVHRTRYLDAEYNFPKGGRDHRARVRARRRERNNTSRQTTPREPVVGSANNSSNDSPRAQRIDEQHTQRLQAENARLGQQLKEARKHALLPSQVHVEAKADSSRYQELAGQIVKEREHAQRLQAHLEETEAAIEGLTSQVEQKEQMYLGQKALLDGKDELTDGLRTRLSQEIEAKASLQTDLRNQFARVDELEQKMVALESQNGDLAAELGKQRAHGEKLAAQLFKNEKRLEEARSLETDLEASKADQQESLKVLEQVRTEQTELTRENQLLRSELKEQSSRVAELERDLATALKLAAEAQKVGAALGLAQEALNGWGETIAFAERLVGIEQQYERVIAALAKTERDLAAALRIQKGLREKVEGELKELLEEKAKLEKDLANARHHLESSKGLAKGWETQAGLLNRILEGKKPVSLADELSGFESGPVISVTMTSELKDQIATLERQLFAAVDQVDGLEREAQQKDGVIRTVVLANQKLTGQLAEQKELLSSMSQSESPINKLRETIAGLRSQIEKYKSWIADYEAKETKVERQHKTEIRDARELQRETEVELAGVQSELENTRKEIDSQTRYRHQLGLTTAEVDRLKREKKLETEYAEDARSYALELKKRLEAQQLREEK